MIQLIVILLLTGVLAGGCSIKDPVTIGLDQYMQDPSAYRDNRVIIDAELSDLLSRYEQYRNRKVTITAPFSYFGSRRFWTWYVLLENNGKKLTCYTHRYRVEPGWDALHLLRWARHEKGDITVVGTLKRDGLDLERLIYKEQHVLTSYKPPRPSHYFWWPYY